jgi:hypothetical protein
LIVFAGAANQVHKKTRKLRVQYPGAIYHAKNRRDRREPIFLDDADYQEFLATLGEACGKTDWQVHAPFRIGITHCKQRGTASSDRFCPPI